MLIERALTAALSLKAAYEDLRPDDPAAATKWQEVVDAAAADMTEVQKPKIEPSAALAEYLLSG